MENASKALIMAGGILIALMVLGALMLMFNNLSSYQNYSDQNLEEAQIVEFNNQFVTYNRNDVRGNELYSLLNRVVDYNERKSSKGIIGKELSYQPMTVSFSIDRSKLKYGNTNWLFTKNTYTEDSNTSQFEQDIVSKVNEIEGNKMIQTLVLNINTILNKNDQSNASKKYYEITGKSEIDDKVEEDMLKYYEFVQFKRAHFNCTNIEYDKNNGRVIKMEFNFNGNIG